MIAFAQLISKFSLRIALDVYFARKAALHTSKDRKQIPRCNVPHHEKIDVTLCPLFAAGD